MPIEPNTLTNWAITLHVRSEALLLVVKTC